MNVLSRRMLLLYAEVPLIYVKVFITDSFSLTVTCPALLFAQMCVCICNAIVRLHVCLHTLRSLLISV